MSIVLASDIGLRLIDLRKATGLTQQDLARRAGRSKADTWRAWEQGGYTPNARFFEDLAEREGWPVGIFAEGGPMPSEVVNRAVNEKERKPLTQDIGSNEQRNVTQIQLVGLDELSGKLDRIEHLCERILTRLPGDFGDLGEAAGAVDDAGD